MRRLKLEPSDLNVQVAQVLDFFRPKAQEGRIEVVDYLSSDLATVLLDRESFHGALLNLVLNAQQAMPEGGQLVVRTYNTAQGVALDLIDTGCGMDAETQAHAFDAFYSTKTGGSGLGLPTTRKIIEAHGGRISLAERAGPRHAVHDRAARAPAAAGRRRADGVLARGKQGVAADTIESVMSNQSYLCCHNHPDIYPAHGYAEFDPELHTLASGVYCVPLTWLAFFSADSLVTRTFSVHGDKVVATAPISSRELCLDRFSTQLARLTQLIAIPGEVLDDYGRFLRLALENAEGEFATIELDEIACMGDEAKFYHNLLIVLLALGGKEKLGARDACLSFGDLDLSR